MARPNPGRAGRPAHGPAAHRGALVEEVALHFAERFAPADRAYAVTAEVPRWHGSVHEALRVLREARLVRRNGAPALTAAGRRAVDAAREAAEQGDVSAGAPAEEPLLVSGVIAAPLRTAEARELVGFSGRTDEAIPVLAEINLRFDRGPDAAFARLDHLWRRVSGGPGPRRVAGQYATGELSMHEVERLVAADAAPVVWPLRSVHRIWPDFPVHLHVDASCVTVKADAARRSFNAHGERIVWAVVDTGIDGTHPHFLGHRTVDHPDVAGLHRDFTGGTSPADALIDTSGHGTHVAGIIAGAVAPWLDEKPGMRTVRATESRHNPASPDEPMNVPRRIDDTALLAGIAPRARLVSLKAVSGGGTQAGPGAPGDRGAGLRPAGQRRGHGRHAHPRRQPQRRLRVRPRVVRLRTQPAVQGGRQDSSAPASSWWSRRATRATETLSCSVAGRRPSASA